MKNILQPFIILILVLLSIETSYSQSGWKQSKGSFFNDDISNVFFDDTNIYLVGWGALYSSSDLGQSWKNLSAANSTSFSPRWCKWGIKNNNILYIATMSDGLYRSTDEGTSWSRHGSIMGQFLSVYNDTIFSGTVTGLDILYDTTIIGHPIGGNIERVFRHGNFIIAGNLTQQNHYISYNGGLSWINTIQPLNNTSVRSFFVDTIQNIFYLGGRDGYYTSLDTGLTWTYNTWDSIGLGTNSIKKYSDTLIAGISYSDWPYKGFLISTDNGVNWSNLNEGLPPYSSVMEVFKHNGRLYCTAKNSYNNRGLFIYDNLLSKWINISNNAHSGQIHCVTKWNSLLFASGYGGLMKSSDYGNTWDYIQPYLNSYLGKFAVLNDTIYLMTQNTFHRSTNGSGWQTIGYPYDAIDFLISKSNNFYYARSSGGLYVSTNQGVTWNKKNTPTDYLNSLECLSDSSLLLGTSGLGIYRSTNEGNSWFPYKLGLENRKILDITQNEHSVYLLTTVGSTNINTIHFAAFNDANWNQMTFPFEDAKITSIACYSDTIIVGTKGGKGVYYTINNGINWNVFNDSLTANNAYSLFVDNLNYIYMADEFFGLYYYKLDSRIPVELTNFALKVISNDIQIDWKTATELNTDRFEIQRSNNGIDWQTIATIKGYGTTTIPRSYSYTDKRLSVDKYKYRLKIIDNDGSIEYSNIIEAEVGIPTDFSLSQNYPNPFNPRTRIEYTLPYKTNVRIELFSITGQLLTTLVNKEQEAGYYFLDFDATGLSSGAYIYRLKMNEKGISKKLLFLK